MRSDVMQGSRFGLCSEIAFSDGENFILIAVLQGGQFVTSQESRFQAAEVHIWDLPSCKEVDLVLLKDRVFGLRNVPIWAVPSCKGVDF